MSHQDDLVRGGSGRTDADVNESGSICCLCLLLIVAFVFAMFVGGCTPERRLRDSLRGIAL